MKIVKKPIPLVDNNKLGFIPLFPHECIHKHKITNLEHITIGKREETFATYQLEKTLSYKTIYITIVLAAISDHGNSPPHLQHSYT